MKILSWSNRGLGKEVATNPEFFIFLIVLGLITVLGRQVPGALGYCQILGLSLALSGLWIIIFPRYLQRASSSDIAAKSTLLLLAGGMIIFADWVRAKFHAIMLIAAGKDALIAIPGWIWVIGGLTAASGLLGILLGKRLSLAVRSCPSIILRLCAVLVLCAGILLIVRATIAGNELLQIGANGG